MESTLSELWRRYRLLSEFKLGMNRLGHVGKSVYCLKIQIDLLREIIEIESNTTLKELMKKTYYRILKSIEKGIEHLPDIITNPETWVLNPIEKDSDAWISDDVLIFSTKSNTAVFSKKSRKSDGFKYIDGKYQ